MLARACADSMVAITSFWLVRITGIRSIYFMCTLLLGGAFAPIAVLPDWLATIARALPFYWAFGFPIELLVGRADAADAFTGIAVLGAWSVVLLALLQPAWRAGTRAYEAVGQ
jgi:ABC-2 type transport system permease protein